MGRLKIKTNAVDIVIFVVEIFRVNNAVLHWIDHWIEANEINIASV